MGFYSLVLKTIKTAEIPSVQYSTHLMSYAGSQLILGPIAGETLIYEIGPKLCHYSCSQCTSSFDPAACTTCKTGFSLNPDQTCSPQSVQTQCGDHEFMRYPGRCSKCDSSCKTCFDVTALSCLTCPAGHIISLKNSCKSLEQLKTQYNCGPSTYFDTSSNLCKACPYSCTSCTTASSCQACRAPEFILNTATSSCELKCSGGRYYDYRKGQCSPCHPGCSTCSGPSHNECLSCNSNYFFHE